MDYKRIAIAAVGAWVVDNIYAVIVWMRLMVPEMANNPGVFRTEAQMSSNMPMMFLGGLLAMFVLAYMYAKGYEGGSGFGEGLRFGLLIALFTLGFVSIGIYGSFNISARLGVLGAVCSFVEVMIVGVTIGLLYRPAA